MEKRSLKVILTIVRYVITLIIGYLSGDGTVSNFLNL